MTQHQGKVYLVDDEEAMRISMSQWLELADFSVQCFDSATQVLELIDSAFDGVLVTDIRMPDIDGLELMHRVLTIDRKIPVVLITAHGDIPMAVTAMRKGAYDFIEKPFEPDILLETIRRAEEQRKLVLENRALRKKLNETMSESGDLEKKLLGTSDAIQFLRREIKDLAPTDAGIFLFGETGAGKEITARCLHDESDRADKEFVAINCGAIPETLFESELFGHEQGAFTGAVARRIGKFERADGGTLFLDEINNMPLNLQAKVLRVLQEKEIERLGGNKPIPIDIRVIGATNIDPEEACRQGTLRTDLYYRLNVARITIPPLKQRGRDIILLFEYFANLAEKRYERKFRPPTPSDITVLMSHTWPGNVRELKNLAERYVLSSHKMDNHISYLLNQAEPVMTENPSHSLSQQMETFERCVLEQSLQKHSGNIAAVMEELDMPRRTLNDKMQKHGISRKSYL